MPSAVPSRLQEEIQQTRPFASVQDEALLSIMRTADVLKRGIARVVEPFGITVQQYNVLRILRGAGSDGLPTLEVADRMIETAPGITRMIDRLEAKSLVIRERGTGDRRQVLCRITQTGLALLADLDHPMRQQARTAVGETTVTQLTSLVQTLDQIREANA